MQYACAVLWQRPDGKWTFDYVWQSTNWPVHADVIALVLMLVVSLVVLCRATWIYHSIIGRPANGAFRSFQNRTISELAGECICVKSIASTAPALGLAGTCFAMLYAFRGVEGDRQSVTLYMASQAGICLITTVIGLGTGVIARFIEYYVRHRIEVIKPLDLANEYCPQWPAFSERHSSRFPLQPCFSQLPGFPIMAAPSLILLLAWFMPSHVSKGFLVHITKTTDTAATNADAAPPITIAVAQQHNKGPRFLYLNGKPLSEGALRQALQSQEASSTQLTYVQADDNVRWAEVLDTIDAVESVNRNVVLLTVPPDLKPLRPQRASKAKR